MVKKDNVTKEDLTLLFLILVLVVVLLTGFGMITGHLIQQKVTVYVCFIKNISLNETPVSLDVGDIWVHEAINYTVKYPPEYALNNYTINVTIFFSDNTNLFDINYSTGEIYYEALVGDIGTYNVGIVVSEQDNKCLPQYRNFTITVIGEEITGGGNPCVPQWICSAWSSCIRNTKSRTCTEFCSGDRKLQTMGCLSGKCFEDSDCGNPNIWDCRNDLCHRVGCRNDADCLEDLGEGWECEDYECIPIIVEEDVELEELPKEKPAPPLRLLLINEFKTDNDLYKIYYETEPTPAGLWLKDILTKFGNWVISLFYI